MATGTIYIGHDNALTLTFTDNNVAEDFSAATKFEVVLGSVSINSVDTPTAFDLTDKASGSIDLLFGAQAIDAGEYAARVVVYDAVNDDGIVWAHEDDEDPLMITVVED